MMASADHMRRLVLNFDTFKVLKDMVLRWPEESSLSILQPEVAELLEYKFIRQTPSGKYLPTEAGVYHITPGHLKKQA